MQKAFTFEFEYLFQLESKLERLIDKGYHIDSVQIIPIDDYRENNYEALVIVSKEEFVVDEINPQCPNCIHREVCKNAETYREIVIHISNEVGNMPDWLAYRLA